MFIFLKFLFCKVLFVLLSKMLRWLIFFGGGLFVGRRVMGGYEWCKKYTFGAMMICFKFLFVVERMVVFNNFVIVG